MFEVTCPKRKGRGTDIAVDSRSKTVLFSPSPRGKSRQMRDETIVREFVLENRENLDLLERALIGLEEDPDTLVGMYRSINTLRGTSRLLGFRKLAALCYEGETLVNRMEHGLLATTPDITAALRKMVQASRQMLLSIVQTGTEGEQNNQDLIETLIRLQENPNPWPAGRPSQASLICESAVSALDAKAAHQPS